MYTEIGLKNSLLGTYWSPHVLERFLALFAKPISYDTNHTTGKAYSTLV